MSPAAPDVPGLAAQPPRGSHLYAEVKREFAARGLTDAMLYNNE
jgi:hypothetical protein